MAKRILRKKQGELVDGDSDPHGQVIDKTNLSLNEIEPKPSTSKAAIRTHDSESAVWQDNYVDRLSIAPSSNIIAISNKSFDLSDSDEIAIYNDAYVPDLNSSEDETRQQSLPHTQLGGIDEIAINQDTETNRIVTQSENVSVRSEVPTKSNQESKVKHFPNIPCDSVQRSDSTKRLLGSSSASSTISDGASNIGIEFDQVLYTESEHDKKRISEPALVELNAESEEKENLIILAEPSEAEVKKIVQNQQNKQQKLDQSININNQFIERTEKKGLLWQQAPRELILDNKIPIDEIHRIKPTQASRFHENIRIFKPPRLKSQKQKSDIKILQGIIDITKPQSFTQIGAEIPPDKASKYKPNAGSFFLSDKYHRVPVLSKMAANHVTSHKQRVTATSSLYADNGAISRYTLRGLSALPQELNVVAVPPEMQRTTLRKARNAIEMAISNFQIIFDNSTVNYQPGMPIVGKVIMDVWSTVDIRYVEFVLQGRATIRMFGNNGRKFSERPQSEVYLQKRIILISPAEGQLSKTLTPGKYVSEFAYKLPENLPASVEQTDVSDSCVFSLTYSARANVCDFLHARHVPQSDRYAQVVKTCRREFTVKPQYDYRCLPGAMDPITHAEQFNVICSPLNKAQTSVLVKLDHQLFAIGDVLDLSLEVCSPDTSRIKNITANMVQTVIFQPPVARKFRKTVIKAIDLQRSKHQKNKRNGQNATNGNSVYRCSFGIPIPNNLIPSLLVYARIIQVSYSMDIKVSFKHMGGALRMRVPVVLTSAMEPEVVNTVPSVPVFNKPVKQFPYFSREPLRDSMKSLASVKSSGSNDNKQANKNPQSFGQKHERVRAKYVHCFTC